ncbi:pyruvate formate lyase activating enzyme [Modicisalibacter xianhensis]|uniref:Pyruvate formate lyase activating enzyme n=1 Tax=Modicisalibacter xianhensis TaxID=442341 RepID=A0A4R8G0H7_9GAMM|nr:anaerobic ribonucleoside-triphosphate reductase activating protein [Halomonas xianhensis]TDX29452.1 pyruvate formate lyase activating enzyme [Halomonas xianhensis]
MKTLDALRTCLPVAGLTPMTTLDFPERLACVVFTQGCPLRCGYCHNPLMLSPRRGKPYEWQDVCDFLEDRQGLLDGVVISGGEPTLHRELPAALRDIKQRGFATGLHTAGVYPERLVQALPWLDWVGLDIKGWGPDFDRICGRRGMWRRNVQSLALLLDAGIELECRTTVHWRDFSLRDVEKLAMSLADCGVKRYVLQIARHEQCLDPHYTLPLSGVPSEHAVDLLVSRLAPHFEQITVRR